MVASKNLGIYKKYHYKNTQAGVKPNSLNKWVIGHRFAASLSRLDRLKALSKVERLLGCAGSEVNKFTSYRFAIPAHGER
jgi:hypothetical protein